MIGAIGTPVWEATAQPGPTTAPLKSGATTDVVIVGAGFLGLSAAAALASAGVDVIVLDAGDIGAGASGRNAGFVVPHFSRADPAELAQRLSQRAAEQTLGLLESGADRVFALATEAGLGRQAEQVGWLQPAHEPASADLLQKRVAMWQARGRPVRWLDRAEVAERTGTSGYFGALEDASGGMINPLAFARALARRAIAAGVQLHTRTTAMDIATDGNAHTLRLSTGATVRATRVLLASNAGTTGAARKLGQSVLPLSVYQIATEPLPAETVARIAPRRQPVSDTRTNIFTYRLDADNRLISGGMALIPYAAERRMARRIAERLAQQLDLGSVPQIDAVWRGTAAMTRDGLPLLTTAGAGIFGAVGCNGRGVAFTTVLGEALGNWMAAGADPNEAPLPLLPSRALPLRGLARWAPSLVLLRGILAERGATARAE
ncbi:MAG: FAD-binding oxidoreductase [Gemmobacter sp.]|nr:FAD-binding oxidoreductase [Gemmobacter sp.]